MGRYYSHHHHYSHHFPNHHGHSSFSGKNIAIISLIAVIAVIFYWNFKKMKQIRLQKKKSQISRVVVAGGAQGVGRELAIQFAKHHNCHVVIFDHRKDHIQDLMEQIERSGGKGHFYDCNILDKDSLMKAIAMTIAEVGYVDVLVNATGKTLEKNFEAYSHDEIAGIIESNLVCPMILIKEFLALMEKRGYGHIVDVTSQTEHLHSLDTFAYFGAKHGVTRFLRSLQRELRYTHPEIKITVTKPIFLLHCKPKQDREYKEQVAAYAERIYHGVMAEKRVV